jgi:hypothetical protein
MATTITTRPPRMTKRRIVCCLYNTRMLCVVIYWCVNFSFILCLNNIGTSLNDGQMLSEHCMFYSRLNLLPVWDFKFSRRRLWSSESSGMYCRVLNWISTDVSEVRAASIMRALMVDAARTSETSVYITLRTRQYIPEDSELQTCCRLQLSSCGHIYVYKLSLCVVKPP